MLSPLSALRCGSGLALALALAGCGHFGAPAHGSASPAGAGGGPAAPGQATRSRPSLAGMIDAVGPGTHRAPVDLKFEIRSRPEVGVPDEIDYALVPGKADIDDLTVLFGARSGLEVLGAGARRQLPKPTAGVPILGSIRFTPVSAGIFTVTAAVGVVRGTQTVVWPFSIPVITGGDSPGGTVLSAGAAKSGD